MNLWAVLTKTKISVNDVIHIRHGEVNGWKGDDEVSWLGSRDNVTTVTPIKNPKILKEFQHIQANPRNTIRGMVVGFTESLLGLSRVFKKAMTRSSFWLWKLQHGIHSPSSGFYRHTAHFS